jgi:hypothetical protein
MRWDVKVSDRFDCTVDRFSLEAEDLREAERKARIRIEGLVVQKAVSRSALPLRWGVAPASVGGVT